MRGHQRYTQAARREHHDDLFGVGQLGQKLGVPGEGDTALIDYALVHGSGNHPSKMPVQAALAGAGQGVQDIGGIGCVELARDDRCTQWRIPDIQAARRGWCNGPGARSNGDQADVQAQLLGALA